ncbi:uncharacterized protein DS421_1g10690 [Arachis hypogaea]|nr:uncharacterized protein DS421_1g10690 [Arachis hypogaea]
MSWIELLQSQKLLPVYFINKVTSCLSRVHVGHAYASYCDFLATRTRRIAIFWPRIRFA